VPWNFSINHIVSSDWHSRVLHANLEWSCPKLAIRYYSEHAADCTVNTNLCLFCSAADDENWEMAVSCHLLHKLRTATLTAVRDATRLLFSKYLLATNTSVACILAGTGDVMTQHYEKLRRVRSDLCPVRTRNQCIQVTLSWINVRHCRNWQFKLLKSVFVTFMTFVDCTVCAVYGSILRGIVHWLIIAPSCRMPHCLSHTGRQYKVIIDTI